MKDIESGLSGPMDGVLWLHLEPKRRDFIQKFSVRTDERIEKFESFLLKKWQSVREVN